jgi:hypothetical protein
MVSVRIIICFCFIEGFGIANRNVSDKSLGPGRQLGGKRGAGQSVIIPYKLLYNNSRPRFELNRRRNGRPELLDLSRHKINNPLDCSVFYWRGLNSFESLKKTSQQGLKVEVPSLMILPAILPITFHESAFCLGIRDETCFQVQIFDRVMFAHFADCEYQGSETGHCA